MLCYNVVEYVIKRGDFMYTSIWGEEIVADNTISNGYLDVIMAGITHPNPTYRIMHNISKQFPYDYYVFEYVVKGVGHIETPERKMHLNPFFREPTPVNHSTV